MTSPSDVTLGGFALEVRKRELEAGLRVASARALAESGASFASSLADAKYLLRAVAAALGDVEREMKGWRCPDAGRR